MSVSLIVRVHGTVNSFGFVGTFDSVTVRRLCSLGFDLFRKLPIQLVQLGSTLLFVMDRKLFSPTLVAVIAILCLCGPSANALDDARLFEELPTEERLEELRQIAEEIVKIKPTRKSSVSVNDLRKLQKIEKRVDPSEFKLVWELYDEIVDERERRKLEAKRKKTKNSDETNPEPELDASTLKPMEEMFVVGTPFAIGMLQQWNVMETAEKHTVANAS